MNFENIATLVNHKVLERQGRPLKDVERLVLQGAWENQTYAAMAAPSVGYTEDYLKKDVGPKLWRLLSQTVAVDQPGIKVTKRNIQNVLRTWANQTRQDAYDNTGPTPGSLGRTMAPPGLPPVRSQPPVDITDCCGRQTELSTLSQWVMGDRCRLIVLWGLMGSGKTTLAAQLMARLESQLDRVGYLALGKSAPAPLVVPALSNWLDPDTASVSTGTPEALIDQLQRRRCLVLIDNLEQGFVPRQMAGTYSSEAEGLAQWLQQVADSDHQSCVVLISRERPADLPQRLSLRVREMNLSDLAPTVMAPYLSPSAAVKGSAAAWSSLTQRYGGNPLLLRELGATVQAVYQGQLQPFLATEPDFLPTSIQQRLDHLFERLTPEEQGLLYWLILIQAPAPLTEVMAATVDPIGAEAVQSLLGRGLGHGGSGHESSTMVLALQPMVRIWGLHHLRSRLDRELDTEQLDWFCRLPLVTMTAREVVQEQQRAALLRPLVAALELRYPSPAERTAKEYRLRQALPVGVPGYGAGNLIHLCQALGISLSGTDLSNLAIWQGDLRRVSLQGANLSQVQFKDTVFATALGRSPVAAFSAVGDRSPHANIHYLATGDHEGRLLLWDRYRGRLLRVLDDGVSPAIHTLAFSPQGDVLAVGTETGQIWLRPVQTSYQGDGLFEHRAAVRALAFSPDGRQLASGDDTGCICLWDVASGLIQGKLQGHQGAIHSLAFDSTGTQLISGGDDQRACLWDVPHQTLICPFQARTTGWVRTAGFLPDPEDPTCAPLPCAAGYDEHGLTLWNLKTGRPCWMLPADGQAVLAMALSPNGRYLVCSRQDFTVTLWDIPRRTECHTLPSLGLPVWTLAFSADSRYLVTGSDYTVKLWSAETGDGLRSLISQAHPLRTWAFGAGQLLTGHRDTPLRLWHLTTTGISGPQLLTGHTGAIQAVAISEDGMAVASSADDRTIRLWSTTASADPQVLSTAPATLLQFSGDHRWLASAHDDAVIRLWEVSTGRLVTSLEGHPAAPSALAFSPDSQYLFSGHRDGTIRVLSLAQPPRNQNQILLGHQGQVHSLAMSSDGGQLTSASHDGTLRWWDLDRGDQLGQWQPPAEHWLHGGTINSKGDILAFTSQGADLTVWAVQPHQRWYLLKGHSQAIWQVQVSGDRTRLISASQDDEIRLWSLDQGTCQQVLRPNRPYEGVNIWGATGLSEPETAMLKALGATERF